MLSEAISAGYPALAAAVVLGAFGAPLPLSVALAGAGSMARQGHLDLGLLFLICASAAVAGDTLGYVAGRYGLRHLHLPDWSAAWVTRLKRSQPGIVKLSAPMGLWVFMTRWAFTAPAPLVNVLAGTRRYPWRSFLFFDITGESLWCVTALVPGYLLGEVGELSLPLSMGAGLALSLGGLLLSRAPRLKAMVFDELPLTTEAAVTHHTV